MCLRMLIVVCCTLVGGVSVFAQPVSTVFSCSFETTDTPGTGYTNGAQIHTAGGSPYYWNWSGSDIGRVTNEAAAVRSGAQGLRAIRSTTTGSQFLWTRANNAFAAINVTTNVIYISLHVKSSGWASSANSFLEIWALGADANASDGGANKEMRTGYVSLRGNGTFIGYNSSNSSAVTLASGVAVDSWNNIGIELFVTNKKYNVYLNGSKVATNFAFFGGGNITQIYSLQFKEYNNNTSAGGVYIDDVSVQLWGPLGVPTLAQWAMICLVVIIVFLGVKHILANRSPSSPVPT